MYFYYEVLSRCIADLDYPTAYIFDFTFHNNCNDSHSPSAIALVPRRSSCKMWSGAQSPLPPQLDVMVLKLRLPDFSILLLIMVTILTSDHVYFHLSLWLFTIYQPKLIGRILIYRQYYIRLSSENCNRGLLMLDTPARLCTLTISTLF